MTHHQDLAALLEGALSAARSHEDDRACKLMREVVRRAGSLPPGALEGGAGQLPVGFYVNSARAFLHIHRYSAIE